MRRDGAEFDTVLRVFLRVIAYCLQAHGQPIANELPASCRSQRSAFARKSDVHAPQLLPARRGGSAMGPGFGVECARRGGCVVKKIRDHRVAPIFSPPPVLPPQNRSTLRCRRDRLPSVKSPSLPTRHFSPWRQSTSACYPANQRHRSAHGPKP